MTRKLAFLCLLSALIAPAIVQALGLGDIRLNSALNQPLDAEIQLYSATDGELESLKASVASVETFESFGLSRPSFLDSLAFVVTQDAAGRPVLQVSSRQPVTEPFVTFLIEVNWSRGQLLREYTVLLDPPLFAPTDEPRYVQPAPARQAPVVTQPAQMPAQPTPQPTAVLPQPAPAPMEPLPRPAPTTTSPAPQPEYPDVYPVSAGDYGPVIRNETLWSIASRLRPDTSVDINQMMIAVFRENPGAFAGNINILREGAILRIPDLSAIHAISKSEAFADARSQIDQWQASKGQLRLVAPEDTAVTGLAYDPGADDFAVDTELEDLGAQQDFSTQPGGDTDTGSLIDVEDSSLAALQDQLSATDDLSTETSLADLEGEIEFTSPGVDLEGSTSELPLDDDVTGLTGDAVQDEGPGVAEGAGGEPPSVQAQQPPAVVSTSISKPTLMDNIFDMLSNTWLWVAIGLTLMLISAVVFVRRRQEADDLSQTFQGFDEALDEGSDTEMLRRITPDHDDSIVVEEGVTGLVEEETLTIKPHGDDEDVLDLDLGPAVADIGATGEGGGLATPDLDSTMALEHGDPLAEADFHMAYGLYDQAAEIVQKAAAREPERRDLRMKLLEIFFVWGNKESFQAEAKALKDSIGDAADSDWDKIIIMGRQICPDEPMFAGAAAAGPGADVDLELEPTVIARAEVDFATIADDEGDASEAGIDLDLGEVAGDTRIAEAPDLTAAEESLNDLVDFDLSGSEADETRLDDSESLLSDDLSEDFGFAAEPKPEPEPDLASQTIREKLDTGIEAGAIDLSDMTAELELDDLGLDLDLGETAETPALDEEATRIEGSLTSELNALAEQRAAEGDVDITAESTAIIESDDSTDTSIQTALTEIPEQLQEKAASAGDGSVSMPVDFDFEETGRSSTVSQQGDATRLASDALDDTDIRAIAGDIDLDATAELLADALGSEDETAELPIVSEDEIDLDLSDVDQQLDDTQEQTSINGDSIDLDIGDFRDEIADSSPTDTARISPADLGLPDDSEAETMSEIGTKLDLARAYMDMGDPHGARSILQEVIEEGSDTQKQEAQQLLDNLP